MFVCFCILPINSKQCCGLPEGSKETLAPKSEETPSPVAAAKDSLPSLDAVKPDDNPFAGLFSTCERLPNQHLSDFLQ